MKKLLVIFSSLAFGLVIGCIPPPSGPTTPPQPEPSQQVEEQAPPTQEEYVEDDANGEVHATVVDDDGQEEVHATVIDDSGTTQIHLKSKKRKKYNGKETEEGELTIKNADGQVIHYKVKGNKATMQVVNPETGESVEVEAEGEDNGD